MQIAMMDAFRSEAIKAKEEFDWPFKPRKEWVILAPERLVKMDPIAVEILQLVDGEKTVKIIANELSKKFNAPLETILADVIEMLQGLSDKGFIEENG